MHISLIVSALAPLLSLLLCCGALAATEDLGNGFLHHGVATPVSNHRGIVCTVDGNGRNVVLIWLFDHTGGYALLMVDVETGKSEQYKVPFPPGGDCPYASLLSSRNRYYTHFNSYFCEFDPVQRKFTFFQKTAPQMAMGMAEDDNGVIWSVTYPQSGVVCYNPATGEFKDYGHVYRQNWAQYQRYVAADDRGYIYFSVSSTARQIIIFDPKTGTATPVIPDAERVHGDASITRDVNGKVYAQLTGGGDQPWYELYDGKARKLDAPPKITPKRCITGSQGLFWSTFPDGSRLRRCDTVERTMEWVSADGKQSRMIHFDYTSEGAHIMGLCAAPDGTICGGTAFPMRFFSYDPREDKWVNRDCYGQANTVTSTKDRFFIGGYTHGFLLEYDPSKPWVPTAKGNPDSNPRLLTECDATINRPHGLLASPDGNIIVMAGTPGYGFTGGGLLIYDRRDGSQTLLTHTDLLPDHATMGLAWLPNGNLLVGSTIAPGTGGETKAKVAELYELDMKTHKVLWHEAFLPGVANYMNLCPGPGGVIYGIADQTIFFVFDPASRTIVHQQKLTPDLGPTVSQQGTRALIPAPDGKVYLLLNKGIARIEPDGYKITLLATSPVPIGLGGDILDGRIYFGNASHVYSWKLPEP
jgi:streptogramin lyase